MGFDFADNSTNVHGDNGGIGGNNFMAQLPGGNSALLWIGGAAALLLLLVIVRK